MKTKLIMYYEDGQTIYYITSDCDVVCIRAKDKNCNIIRPFNALQIIIYLFSFFSL